MEPFKVYLAKSQQADPNMVRLVYEHLRELKKTFPIEIVEHIGPSEKYNPDLAMKSHAMIIVPPVLIANNNRNVFIGKGLWSTLQDYLFGDDPDDAIYDDLANETPLVAFSEGDIAKLLFWPVADAHLRNLNWKNEYGLLDLTGEVADNANAFWKLDNYLLDPPLADRFMGDAGPLPTHDDLLRAAYLADLKKNESSN